MQKLTKSERINLKHISTRYDTEAFTNDDIHYMMSALEDALITIDLFERERDSLAEQYERALLLDRTESA